MLRKISCILNLFAFLILVLNDIKAQTVYETKINLKNTKQLIQGFGAANILPWRPDMKSSEIKKAFGTNDGELGFTILRLRVPPNLNEFAMNVPTAKAAYSMGVKIIASPWSPPAYMKSNNNIVGGRLLEEYYDDYAAHLKSFADYMESNGVPLYAISVQNEPDIQVTYESCDWTAEEMKKFIREYAPSIGVRIIAPESYNFNRAMSDPILNDSIAAANVSIIGGHIYGGGLASYPLAEAKGKEIWMTEHLDTDTTWSKVLATAVEMHQVMNYGMNAYIWWYIVRYYGPILENSEVSKRGYVMSQFSRFIRPGYKRLEVITNTRVRTFFVTAYRSDNKLVIVVINTGGPIEQKFILQNGSVDKFTPYVTTKTKNCQKGDDISITDSSFTFNFEGESVTTFVSNNLLVSVENQEKLPVDFELYQNYPNPFNPTTVISYELSSSNYVLLKVYDIMGREIRTLVNEFKEPGKYEIEFNGVDLSTGVYFYKLQVGNKNKIKKTILIK